MNSNNGLLEKQIRMTSEEQKSIESLLVDVRKSYRFIYEYQRRVMDLITFIGGYWDFVYEKGEPVFCRPPSHKKINPSVNWAWDFLLFYNYNFVYTSKDLGSWKNLKLMLNIVSDNGFYETDSNASRLNINSFEASEVSKTELHIILKSTGVEWFDYQSKQYSAKNGDDTYVNKDEKSSTIIIGQKFNLTQLTNEGDVLRSLNMFEELCFAHQIYLERKNDKSD